MTSTVRDQVGAEPLATATRVVARLLAHREVSAQHYRMRLQVGSMAAKVQAGQFVHVLPRAAAACDPLLRRAFSIMAADGEAIEILYRVMGRGTALLSRLQAGDEVDIIGPLGQPFAPLGAHSILVGGGVGVPPLVMLASTRGDSGRAGADAGKLPAITALIGARSDKELIGISDFQKFEVEVAVSTDDGSAGHEGRVTDLLEARLKVITDVNPTVYTCGPFAMLRAVAALCQRYEVSCQVSLEENMPCGVGVCNGCVVPVIGAGDDYGRYRRICVDGPVVWAHEIDWEHLSVAAACY